MLSLTKIAEVIDKAIETTIGLLVTEDIKIMVLITEKM